MKVNLDKDEMYPVYSLYPSGIDVEVPDKIVRRWQSVIASYALVQDEMQAYYERSNPYA